MSDLLARSRTTTSRLTDVDLSLAKAEPTDQMKEKQGPQMNRLQGLGLSQAVALDGPRYARCELPQPGLANRSTVGSTVGRPAIDSSTGHPVQRLLCG